MRKPIAWAFMYSLDHPFTDGHIVAWGGVSLWRSLMRLDLIDEFRLDLISSRHR